MSAVPDLPAKALRCGHCNGVWFEMLAHEQLVPFVQRIDTGSAEQGREYNRIDRIHCPACAGEQDLIRMVDPRQPHIWFESCQSCFGRFYDAGEFTDYTQHSFAEWLQDLDAPERPL
jgi:Zn-finger nucleic acid-binding protein